MTVPHHTVRAWANAMRAADVCRFCRHARVTHMAERCTECAAAEPCGGYRDASFTEGLIYCLALDIFKEEAK